MIVTLLAMKQVQADGCASSQHRTIFESVYALTGTFGNGARTFFHNVRRTALQSSSRGRETRLVGATFALAVTRDIAMSPLLLSTLEYMTQYMHVH